MTFDFCLNMVFNFAMHPDTQLIGRFGGATKLAARLGFPIKGGGVQRVQNWKGRGIPASVERDNPWITDERRAMLSANRPEAVPELALATTQEA
ncbi:hypothetical protein [Pantoea sp. 18069]|uniref:hypothetical protein n=1 Tax=Pantoea sp. 18069 TaxID=2681415 RepID=UPI00135765B4|nr:hypothetical protein [Pantoea sp. 18069]